MIKNPQIVTLVLVVIFLSAFIFYFSFQSKFSPLRNQNELTADERNYAVAELREIVSKSPPLTDKERTKAIEELRKTIVNQNK